MFDIGFFELLLIAIVALLVVGPERLPEAVRGMGLWIGRIKRSLSATRAELEQQLGADDIRRQLHNENIMAQLQASRDEIEAAVRGSDVAQELKAGGASIKQALRDDYVEHQELPDHAHASADSPATDAPDTKHD